MRETISTGADAGGRQKMRVSYFLCSWYLYLGANSHVAVIGMEEYVTG